MCLALPSITPDCVVVIYGHGLCVSPLLIVQAPKQILSLVTVPSGRWCAGGMSVFTYMYG